MSTDCGRRFEEALLSGYVDGALTQADEQRVRLHLEDCARCRALVEEMRELREVAMTTRFEVPPDDQWDERPRGGISRIGFGAGWALLVVWALATAGFALWHLLTGPDGLWEKLLVFGVLSGVGLLFLSVLIDRLKSRRTDRYREVKR